MKIQAMTTRRVALAAVFAALYFVLRGIPIIQMFGISGRFTAGDFLLTGIALATGPWSGALSVFVGTILAYPLTGTPFLGVDFLPGVVNVLLAGLILQNHHRIAQVVYAAVLFVFIVSPYSLLFGYGLVPYAWLHIIGLLVVLSPVTARIPSLVKREGKHQLAAIAALAFVGTMGQHLTGGLLYEFTLGVVQGNSIEFLKKSWQIIFWLYPMERLLIVTVSTILSVALVRSIKRLGSLGGFNTTG